MAGVTPNIRLNLPTYDQPGWDTLLNSNLQILDSLVARAVNLVGTYNGIYTPGNSYILNAIVTDPSDSSLWQANSAFTTVPTNTFAQERAGNAGHWTNVTTATANAAVSATLAAGSATIASTSQTASAASQAAASSSATAAAASATAAAAGASFGNMGRNLIHNGSFRIQQRGAGSFTANNAYMADRYQLSLSTSTATVSINTLADADRTALGDESAQFSLGSSCTGTAGAGDFVISPVHKIENVRRLAGKIITLSFWAKASAGNPKVGVEITQVFGTGGSPSASVTNIGSQSSSTTSTWTRYIYTIFMPTIVSKVLGTNGDDYTGINFWMSSGATNNARSGSVGVQTFTYNMWGLQLEIGTTVSPVEKIDPRIELSNCQRFYCIGQSVMNGYGITGAGVGQSVTFPVAMRIQPAMTPTTTSNSNVSTFTLNGALTGNQSLWLSGTVTATGGWNINSVWAASADL